MKRALAFLAAFSVFGFMGLAQFSGEWDTTVYILPGPMSLDTSLTLNYEVAGWTYSGTAVFSGGSFSDFDVSLSGALGAISVEGSMAFDPDDEWLKHFTNLTVIEVGQDEFEVSAYEFGWLVSGPHYKSSELSASMDFAGVSFGLTIDHYTNYTMTFTGYSTVDAWNDAMERLETCFDKYFVTAMEEELDVKATVTFYDDNDTPDDPDDDTVIVSIDAYLELVAPDTLSPAAQAYLDGIRDTIGADYYAWEYDVSDLAYRLWFPDYMTYDFTVSVDPFSAEVVFDDVSTGIQFKEATISFSDLSLCCGVSFDMELAFNKCDGFESLTFSANDLFPICCGIDFDVSVTFTTTGKSISISPNFAGFADACFTLYADLDSSGGDGVDLWLDAIRVDGWKIYCELGDCNYLEIVSFLSPEHAADYGYPAGTFEYIALGFCGPSCCGGQYTVDLKVNFTQGTSLFGIDYISADVSIPLMENFTLNIEFQSDNTLNVGWTFTF